MDHVIIIQNVPISNLQLIVFVRVLLLIAPLMELNASLYQIVLKIQLTGALLEQMENVLYHQLSLEARSVVPYIQLARRYFMDPIYNV